MQSGMVWMGRGFRGRHGCCSTGEQSRAVEVESVAPNAAEGFGGGGFGVRRPLRFLAYRLGLAEPQVEALAAILNDLKTERAQAAVDERRSLAAFADAMAGETFDEAATREAASRRTQSADAVHQAVARALAHIHALLDAEQRQKFAYLLRTGALLM
jgi:Spy/CpxP family protein refolding chaperone